MGRNAQYRHRDGCREGRVPSWDGWEDGDGEKRVEMHSTGTETGVEQAGSPHGMGWKMGMERSG